MSRRSGHRLLVLLAASVSLSACGGDARGPADAASPSAAAEAPASAPPVPTAVVLDAYGQVLPDACERLLTGATDIIAPAGATSPLNAGPPAPEDEPARVALDSVPLPEGAILIDERTTASLETPDQHGIQRVYCIADATPFADVTAVVAWARDHPELAAGDGQRVGLEAVFPRRPQLYVSARLGGAPRPAARELEIDLAPVGWKRTATTGPDGIETVTGRQTGAHVQLRCGGSPTIAVTDEGEPSQAEPVRAGAVCAGLEADGELLLPAAPPATCPDLRYWDLAVRVLGTWDGQAVVLDLTSCDPWAHDPATRWAALLGMQVSGPDVP